MPVLLFISTGLPQAKSFMGIVSFFKRFKTKEKHLQKILTLLFSDMPKAVSLLIGRNEEEIKFVFLPGNTSLMVFQNFFRVFFFVSFQDFIALFSCFSNQVCIFISLVSNFVSFLDFQNFLSSWPLLFILFLIITCLLKLSFKTFCKNSYVRLTLFLYEDV